MDIWSAVKGDKPPFTDGNESWSRQDETNFKHSKKILQREGYGLSLRRKPTDPDLVQVWEACKDLRDRKERVRKATQARLRDERDRTKREKKALARVRKLERQKEAVKQLTAEELEVEQKRQDFMRLLGRKYPNTSIKKESEAFTAWINCDRKNRVFASLDKAYEAFEVRMMKAEARNTASAFYASEQWLRLRYKVLAAADGCCSLCGRTRKDKIKLHVDHIKPRSLYLDEQLNADNLQVLCSDCNLGKSNTCERDWRE